MSTGKAIGYAFGASVVASFATLLVGACLFGFQFADWTEWEGGLLGLVGTIAGIGGAVVGLRLAACGERRARS
jgi:hypothetical protein